MRELRVWRWTWTPRKHRGSRRNSGVSGDPREQEWTSKLDPARSKFDPNTGVQIRAAAQVVIRLPTVANAAVDHDGQGQRGRSNALGMDNRPHRGRDFPQAARLRGVKRVIPATGHLPSGPFARALQVSGLSSRIRTG